MKSMVNGGDPTTQVLWVKHRWSPGVHRFGIYNPGSVEHGWRGHYRSSSGGDEAGSIGICGTELIGHG